MKTVNTLEFRAQMMKHGDSVKELASFLGIHEKTLYYKYSGCDDRCHFSLEEVKRLMDRYKLTPEEVVSIFLAYVENK